MNLTDRGAILTYANVHNKPDTASSRIRGTWLIKYWDELEELHYGREYSFIIFQKVYEVKYARLFPGIKILDCCDPDFWHNKEPFIEMVEEMDAVTTSTEALKEAIQGWTKKPVVCIPDRHDLEYFKEKKIHRGRAREVCWFGYSHNASPLKSVREHLMRNNLAISIIADQPVILSEREVGINLHERFTKWEYETVNREIIKSDFVVMPGSRNPNSRFKSNNKTINSFLLKMPVATSAEELERYLDPKNRQEDADKNYEMAVRDYDVRISVRELKDLIEKIKKEKDAS